VCDLSIPSNGVCRHNTAMHKLLSWLLGLALAVGAVAQKVEHLSYGVAKEQVVDLYLPASRKGFTTIVFVYGGGWHAPRGPSVDFIGQTFQKEGYACALVSHRLGPQSRFPAQAEDVASAYKVAREHALASGGSADSMFLMGHSSGAHLVTLLVADPKYLHRVGSKVSEIKGVIALSTPTNLEPTGKTTGFGDALMAGRGSETFNRDPLLMKNASPIQHVSKSLPPVLMFVGDNDYPALAGDDKLFVDALTRAGGKAALVVVKNCDHMGTIRSAVEETSDVHKRIVKFLAGASLSSY
jgi:acetyl esterase/lipase